MTLSSTLNSSPELISYPRLVSLILAVISTSKSLLPERGISNTEPGLYPQIFCPLLALSPSSMKVLPAAIKSSLNAAFDVSRCSASTRTVLMESTTTDVTFSLTVISISCLNPPKETVTLTSSFLRTSLSISISSTLNFLFVPSS